MGRRAMHERVNAVKRPVDEGLGTMLPDFNDMRGPAVFSLSEAAIGHTNADMDTAVQIVIEQYNRDILDLADTDLLSPDEVYVVSYNRIADNWHAVISTDRMDGRFYEITHDDKAGSTTLTVSRAVHTTVVFDADR